MIETFEGDGSFAKFQAHYKLFGRWPDARCWMHPCAFTHAPEAQFERVQQGRRLMAALEELNEELES